MSEESKIIAYAPTVEEAQARLEKYREDLQRPENHILRVQACFNYVEGE